VKPSVHQTQVHVDTNAIAIARCVKDMVNVVSLQYNKDDEKEEDDENYVKEDDAVILTGMVDGIAQEVYYEEGISLDDNEDDDDDDDLTIHKEDSMRLRNIVIEVKHRMINSPNRLPPLYDQIQCVAYVHKPTPNHS